MSELRIYNAENVYYSPMSHPKYIVDGLIPYGLTILSGSQKIGKSWLVLDLCLAAAKGAEFLGIPIEPIDVLYLSLEDPVYRLQDRMFKITDEPSSRLYFANGGDSIQSGLIGQLRNQLVANPRFKLIVIDTLGKVRQGSGDYSFAKDYEDLGKLKNFADINNIAVLVVHHVRKQDAKDPFDKSSGTKAILACADTQLLLEREGRGSPLGRLVIEGRDLIYQEWKLKFDNCKWEVIERKDADEIQKERVPEIMYRVVDFMMHRNLWEGSSTELLAELGDDEVTPNVLSKYINQFNDEVLRPCGIIYKYHRTGEKRLIRLTNENAE